MDFSTIKELENKYYMNTITKQNICFVRGEGNTLYDELDRPYIDFVSGLGENLLGYNNPDLVAAISNQAQKIINMSNLYYNEQQAKLAVSLLEDTMFDKVLLCNSGAEALVAAVKLARRYYFIRRINRTKILVISDSFREITFGNSFENQMNSPGSNIKFSPQNDLESLKKNLTDDVGTIILETIQPENSVKFINYDFLLNAYALAKSKDIILIMNELITGMGRTGKMFSFENSGIQPDIIAVSKGLGGGIPISAVMTRGEIGSVFRPSDHDTSFCTNPLACAAANVIIKKLKNGLLERVSDIGDYLKAKLYKLNKYDFVMEIRGMGLLLGIELSSKVKAVEIAGKITKEGILIDNTNKNTLLFIPPYTITRAEIDLMVDKLDNLFSTINI